MIEVGKWNYNQASIKTEAFTSQRGIDLPL